jgi:hypothetical protein
LFSTLLLLLLLDFLLASRTEAFSVDVDRRWFARVWILVLADPAFVVALDGDYFMLTVVETVCFVALEGA